MNTIVNYPFLFSVFSFVVFWVAALIGDLLRTTRRPLDEDQRGDFDVVQAAALTLMGLLVGFTFSMAISRYDQRKTLEEAEANAIGTEYVRAGLLPVDDAAKVRELLRNYLDQRLLFYTTTDVKQLPEIAKNTAHLQSDLWSTVQARAALQATPIVTLAASGMNDVLNSQGYTQAAWWNRIPIEAWALLTVIAIGCNLLIGYGARRTSALLFAILPLAVSVSFFLIADIESPRGGVTRVLPQNLMSLSETLHGH